MINNIPGWMTNRDLDILAKISALCPVNSSILEVGSFLGRSTYALHKNKKDSVSLSIIDTFEVSSMYNTDVENFKFKLDGDPILALEASALSKKENSWLPGFKLCLGEDIYKNIDINVCASSDYNKTQDFDLVFIDGGHDRGTVLHDIQKFITHTNLLIGDDFGEQYIKYMGLIDAVSYSKIKYNRTLVCLDNSRLWMLIPNTGYWKEALKVL